MVDIHFEEQKVDVLIQWIILFNECSYKHPKRRAPLALIQTWGGRLDCCQTLRIGLESPGIGIIFPVTNENNLAYFNKFFLT